MHIIPTFSVPFDDRSLFLTRHRYLSQNQAHSQTEDRVGQAFLNFIVVLDYPQIQEIII